MDSMDRNGEDMRPDWVISEKHRHLLHSPLDNSHMDLEGRLMAAANLARASWLLIFSDSIVMADERDRQALQEVASAAATHASAALALFWSTAEAGAGTASQQTTGG